MHWGDRYGEGAMSGKRAMLVVTTGGWASHYGPRGINGPIDDLLFPIQHGILFYPGFEVLPAHVIYRTGRVDQATYPALLEQLGKRLDGLASDPPIAYRRQNGGDYVIPTLTLRDGLVEGEGGLGIHIAG
jgi:NAD(P)H dehydrogenase (quinone)